MKYKYILKFLVIILINFYNLFAYSLNHKIKIENATARSEDDVFYSLVVGFMKTKFKRWKKTFNWNGRQCSR